jgi:hypothetical protein
MERRQLPGYMVSLPERTLRSLSALAGGAVHEVGEVVLPARLRRSRLYQSLVESTLRFLIEQLGQVDGAYPQGEVFPEDFLIRSAAGNVVGLASLAAFSVSPVWVFAALSDVAGAGRGLISEIAEALQQEGLLERGRRFESTDQLLDGLERTAARLADTANIPPLNVAALRVEWQKLRADAARMPRAILPSSERLWTQWRELQQEAAAQKRSVVELSSVMALSALRQFPSGALWFSNAVWTGSRRTGEVIARVLLDHYRVTLKEIHQTGYGRYWVREFRPYVVGAIRQFLPQHVSATERLMRRKK